MTWEGWQWHWHNSSKCQSKCGQGKGLEKGEGEWERRGRVVLLWKFTTGLKVKRCNEPIKNGSQGVAMALAKFQ